MGTQANYQTGDGGVIAVPATQDNLPSGATAKQYIPNAVAISGGTATGLTKLGTRDTSAAYDVVHKATSTTALTAEREITWDVDNAARTVKFTSATPSLGGTNTGDQTITLSSDVTGSGTGAITTTIAAKAVSLAKMADLAANAIVGNNTGSPATPIALTPAQVLPFLGLDALTPGTALTNADATINPGTDKASEYTLPAATLNAAHVLTMGTGGTPTTGLTVWIIRRDLTANIYTVNNGGPAGAAVGKTVILPASPGKPMGACWYFDGVNWNLTAVVYIVA